MPAKVFDILVFFNNNINVKIINKQKVLLKALYINLNKTDVESIIKVKKLV